MLNYKISDFKGFVFNGKHSSEMHLLRVSDGSEYSETLSPTFKDVSAEHIGRDGMFFFDSFYQAKEFEIKIAFDSVTEVDLREIRLWLNDKNIHELIFDEAPYKAYDAKVKDQVQINYNCFTVGGKRIYKGTGTIHFIAYDPFAHNPLKDPTKTDSGYKTSLNDYPDQDYPNKKEWTEASNLGLKGSSDYNCGDLPTYFTLDFTTPEKIDEDCKLENVIKETDSTGKIKIIPIGPSIKIDKLKVGTKYQWDSELGILKEFSAEGKEEICNDLISASLIATIPTGPIEFIGATVNKLDFLYRYY